MQEGNGPDESVQHAPPGPAETAEAVPVQAPPKHNQSVIINVSISFFLSLLVIFARVADTRVAVCCSEKDHSTFDFRTNTKERPRFIGATVQTISVSQTY